MIEDLKDPVNICWICAGSDTRRLCGPLDKGKHLQGIAPEICRTCGFIGKFGISTLIQENTSKYEKSLSDVYYQEYNQEALEARSRERALVDYDRSRSYIEYIEKFIDLGRVKRAIDIGGGEGLFSAVLKELNPHITVYNLEPDVNVVNIGRKLYPSVKQIHGTFENVSELLSASQEFDLVTYWGGLYRTIDPVSTLKQLKGRLSDTAMMFFSFPFMFDEARRQHLKPYDSIREILGNDSMFMPQEPFLDYIFSQDYRVVSKEKIQNKPFRKMVPVYVVAKDQSEKLQITLPSGSETYRDNIKYLSSYACRLTKLFFEQNIPELAKKRFVAWVPEQLIDDFEGAFQSIGISNTAYIVEKIDRHREQDAVKRIGISEVYDLTPDGIFIYDPKGALEAQLLSRLHLNDVFKVYIIESVDPDPFLTLNGQRILATALSLRSA